MKLTVNLPDALYERLKRAASTDPETFALAAIETAVEEDEEWRKPLDLEESE